MVEFKLLSLDVREFILQKVFLQIKKLLGEDIPEEIKIFLKGQLNTLKLTIVLSDDKAADCLKHIHIIAHGLC